MELEKLFEEIYALSNHTTEYGTNYLEWPLDTATKPPMYLNESKLFETIYFEHRLKPLFEQVLREMANSKVKDAIQIILENIGNAIKGWSPQKALGVLRSDKQRCVPKDNDGNPIDKTSWAIQIIIGLQSSIQILKPLRELRDLFPRFFSGLQADRLQEELPLENQAESPQHSQNS